MLEIFTNGSATTLNNPEGGWAFIIIKEGKEILRSSGFIQKSTNNIAKLTAAVEGLKAAKELQQKHSTVEEIMLISDSQLVLKYATGEYKCRKMYLADLYIDLRRLFLELKVSTRWVKDHFGNIYNDIYNDECDRMAKLARENNEQKKT
jgi:ribonuclease HI